MWKFSRYSKKIEWKFERFLRHCGNFSFENLNITSNLNIWIFFNFELTSNCLPYSLHKELFK
jgi:hypothetical protein